MRLSDFEIEVMNVVWAHQPCSAPDIHERIGPDRDVTYSTVKTIVDRLESKGALRRASQTGRTIYYRATVAPDEVRRPMLEAFISRVFAGDRRPLLNHLFRGDALTESDLDYIEKLLEKRRNEGGHR